MKKNSRFTAYFSLWAASLFWASSFSGIKYAQSFYDPMVVVFSRMLLALIILSPFIKTIWKSCSPQKGDIKYLIIMCLGEPCLYFLFEANALRYTTSAQAGMITATLPLLVAVAAFFILKEKLHKNALTGVFLAVIGVIWLCLAGKATEQAPNPLLGNVLEALAMCTATCYIITAKYLSTRYPPFALATAMVISGVIFYFPVLFFPTTTLPTTFSLPHALTVVFLAAFPTIFAFVCYNYGVSRLSASQATTFINLVPVLAVGMGWLFLDETLTKGQYIAASLVLAGVWLSQKKI